MQVKYVCEICGTIYDRRDSATACEIKHTRPIGAFGFYRENETLPDEVRVSFQNGKTEMYIRKSIIMPGAHEKKEAS